MPQITVLEGWLFVVGLKALVGRGDPFVSAISVRGTVQYSTPLEMDSRDSLVNPYARTYFVRSENSSSPILCVHIYRYGRAASTKSEKPPLHVVEMLVLLE